jgi:hypothetical protein
VPPPQLVLGKSIQLHTPLGAEMGASAVGPPTCGDPQAAAARRVRRAAARVGNRVPAWGSRIPGF